MTPEEPKPTPPISDQLPINIPDPRQDATPIIVENDDHSEPERLA